jgi:predicted DNA-binding WGR domain protein
MKIYFFAGRNDAVQSRVSSKIWKIERSGKTVTTHWGPAKFDGKRRKYVLVALLGSKTIQFRSVSDAADFEATIVRRKEASGYQRNPRRGTRG